MVLDKHLLQGPRISAMTPKPLSHTDKGLEYFQRMEGWEAPSANSKSIKGVVGREGDPQNKRLSSLHFPG